MIDLHTHTNCSDGDYSPFELIKLAHKKGLKALAITDHDTVNAYKGDVMNFAKQCDILLVSGVELSSIDEETGQRIHVLGLNIDINDHNLNEACQALTDSRLDYLMRVSTKLHDFGIVVRVDEIIKNNKLITKTHISKDIVSNVNNYDRLASMCGGSIPTYKKFLINYLLPGKPAYAGKNSSFSTNQAIGIVKQAGGKAICAHPSLNVMQGFDFGLIQKLILRNRFDGIETINIKYDQVNKIRFDMTKEFTEFAAQNKIITSGGSDFHGDNKLVYGDFSDLGLSNEPYAVSDAQLQSIIYT